MKVFFLTLLTLPCFATVTITNVTGVSKLINNSDGSVTAYGGIQGGNVTPASFNTASQTCTAASGTCNTCIGNVANGAVGAQHRQMPCNLAGVFKETIITISGTQTTNPTGGKFFLCNGTTEIAATTNLSESLTTTWSDICADISPNDSTCATNINQTITFGVGTDCNNLGNEKVNLKVITRHINVEAGVDDATVNTYTPPPFTPGVEPVPADCVTSKGACFFRLFPGDGKVYFDRDYAPGIASDFPATDASGVTYDNLVLFFLATGTQGDDPSNDITTFNTVTTAENYGILSVTSEGDVSAGSLDGLDNEVRYCFKMASQDTTGNIDHISSTDCTAQGVYNDLNSDCRNVCTSPSEVVGLLTDTSCFIATAAYGTNLDPHVQSLREFKNQYLVPSWIGRKVVKFYYSVSPPIAKFIKQHEPLKVLTRAFLWPVVFGVKLLMSMGFWFFVIPAVVFGGVYALRRRGYL